MKHYDIKLFSCMLARNVKTGFTLVELAIVLVIVGILAGAVLIAEDLIFSAKIRATVQQYGDYKAAAQAFLLKYQCLPGDCINVTKMGFEVETEGNGDGIVGECATQGTFLPCGYDDFGAGTAYKESFHFWRQLSTSLLIKNAIPLMTVTPNDHPFYPFLARLGTYTPSAKLPLTGIDGGSGWVGLKSGWGIQGDMLFDTSAGGGAFRSHGFLLAPLMPVGGTASMGIGGTVFSFGGFLPFVAYAIDKTIDDGVPLTGSIRPWSGVTDAAIAGEPTTRRYNLLASSGGPNSPVCVRNDMADGIEQYNVLYKGPSSNGRCSLILLWGDM